MNKERAFKVFAAVLCGIGSIGAVGTALYTYRLYKAKCKLFEELDKKSHEELLGMISDNIPKNSAILNWDICELIKNLISEILDFKNLSDRESEELKNLLLSKTRESISRVQPSNISYSFQNEISDSIIKLIPHINKPDSFNSDEIEEMRRLFKEKVRSTITSESGKIIEDVIRKAVSSEIVQILGNDKDFWKNLECDVLRVRDEYMALNEFNNFLILISQRNETAKVVKRYDFLLQRCNKRHQIKEVIEESGGTVIVYSGRAGYKLSATNSDYDFDNTVLKIKSRGYVSLFNDKSTSQRIIEEFQIMIDKTSDGEKESFHI